MEWHALSWIINGKCNLHCSHCYPSSSQKDMFALTNEEIQMISSNMATMHFEKIYISGGEPLLCAQLTRYLEVARRHAEKIYICTNSLLLDKDKLALLNEYSVKITVSLQHTDPRKAKAIYGNESTGQAIRKCIETLRNNNTPIKLEITVMRPNYRDLDSFIQFADECGITEIDFKRFRSIGRGAVNSTNFELTPVENAEALNNLFSLSLMHPEMEISTDDPLYGVVILHHLKARGYSEEDALEYLAKMNITGCKAARRWIGMDPDGNVAPCPLLLYCGISIGNVLAKPLEEIIKGSELINTLKDKRCNDCRYSQLCGGCRTCAFSKTGDVMEVDPMCTYYRQEANN